MRLCVCVCVCVCVADKHKKMTVEGKHYMCRKHVEQETENYTPSTHACKNNKQNGYFNTCVKLTFQAFLMK